MHTSGYMMVWVVHYLTLHPAIMENLLQEIKQIDTTCSHDDKQQLRDYVFSDKTYVSLSLKCIGYYVATCMQVPSSSAE